jgi:hypothetical protein
MKNSEKTCRHPSAFILLISKRPRDSRINTLPRGLGTGTFIGTPVSSAPMRQFQRLAFKSSVSN